MKDLFVSYEQAVQLKELGFDEPCFGRYIYDGRGKEWFLVQTQQTKSASVIFEGAKSVDGISVAAPLYQQAFRWFRDEHNLKFHIRQDNWNNWCSVWILISNNEHERVRGYSTYEEAELACLDKLIEIVKNKYDEK
jgi:hypothetical protein